MKYLVAYVLYQFLIFCNGVLQAQGVQTKSPGGVGLACLVLLALLVGSSWVNK